MTEALPAVGIALVCLGGGAALAWACLGGRDGYAPGGLEILAWAPGLAFGPLSILYFFGVLIGVDPPGRLAFGGLAVVSVSLALWRWSRAPSPILPSEPPRVEILEWLSRAMLVVLGVALLWAFFEWREWRPHGTADAIGIWTARALFLHRIDSNVAERFGLFVRGHPDYPLLLPGANAAQLEILGDESLLVPVLLSGVFLLGLLAQVYRAVARHASPGLAGAATALLLSTPIVWRWNFSQCADLPLAYFAVGCVTGVASLVARRGGSGYPAWLVGFFAGCLIWVKNEGLFLAAFFMAILGLGWAIRGELRSRSKTLALFFAGALPGLAAFLLFRWLWQPPSEGFVNQIGLATFTDPERWGVILHAYRSQFDPSRTYAWWGGSWLLLALAFAGALTRRPRSALSPPVLVFGTAFLSGIGFNLTAYLSSPRPLSWHVSNSLDRLLMQILPLLVVAVSAALAAAAPEIAGGTAGERAQGPPSKRPESEHGS